MASALAHDATGDATLPLTFGDFDVTEARWSPDGRRVTYISNEDGNTALWVHEFVGGERVRIEVKQYRYLRPMHALRISVTDAQGAVRSQHVSVLWAATNVPMRLEIGGFMPTTDLIQSASMRRRVTSIAPASAQ